MARQRAAAFIAAIVLLIPVVPAYATDGASSSDPSPSTVKDLPNVPALEVDDPISPAELDDLRYYADQEGLPLEQVIDQFGWTDNFAVAVTAIQQRHPEAFAGAEIVAGRGAWIGFAADAPRDAMDIMRRLEQGHPGVAVAVRRDIGFNEVDLREAIASVHRAAVETAGAKDAVTSFDFDTMRITVTVANDHAARPDRDRIRAAVAERLAASGRAEILDRVAVEVAESGMPVLTHPTAGDVHIGGESLSTCTSAFSVSHWDGRRGIVTASHCQNAQSDDGRALTWQKGHEGVWGDIQWHTGPQAEPDDFYAGDATHLEVGRRDVSGWANAVVGQLLCKNGKTAFRDCDTVMKVNVCTGTGICLQTQMNNNYTQPGDSGGPWYNGNTAYGVTFGYHWDPVWPWARDLFTPVSILDNAIDVTVNRN
jgi:hypothetical protein